MKKLTLKVFSLILALLFVLPLIAACNGGGNGDGEESSYETQMVAGNENDPKIPGVDYGGYEFGVITQPYNEGLAYSTNYIWAESESADALESAVYRRNVAVEDKYNIKISKIETTSVLQDVRTQVMSGTTEFDLISTRCHWLATLARENLLADLLSFEWFDMSKPYWDINGLEDLKIGDKLYFTNSDFVAQELGMLLYFNKQLIADYQLTSPYEYMANNNWNLDTFGTLVKSISEDADNDGDMDEYDRYGILSEHHNARTLLYGCDIRATKNDSTGYPALTLMSDKTVSAYEKIKDILNSNASWCIDCGPSDAHGFNDKWDYMRSWFCQDMFLFHIEGVNIIAQFADMEHEFGIVPVPKYDSTQAEYTTIYPMHCSLIAIPSVCPDPDRTGRIVEDLNYYSSIIVMPTFYDQILSRKYTHDDESEANLDIIKASRVYDLGIYYDFGGIRSKITDVNSAKNNISTNYAKLKKAIEADIEDTYAKFQANANAAAQPAA
ncbi:MAG: hypothetical protein E7655_07825 [Ruminococcaceae bacterium]|nr:hypothetical protein [Oscillospiraceae bacterium]